MKTNRNAEDSVLSANKTRLDNLDRAIKEANERRRRLVEKSKLFTYDTLAELYGLEGQELIDAITAEHMLISRLTAAGMTYEQISELTDGTDTQQTLFSDSK